MSIMDTNQGRTKRVKLYYCSLKLGLVPKAVLKETKSVKLDCGFVKNISESGICISTCSSLSVSDIVCLIFELPSVEHNFFLKGRVIWIRNNEVGLEFQNIREAEKNLIGNYLENIDKESMYKYYQRLQHMFTYSRAESEDEKREVQKLRYLIYAKENNWEPINDTGLEIDEYEDKSEVFMVSDNNDVVIAATRMIPADKYELPIEKHFSVDITQSGAYSRSEIIEISRLCIAREYRRRIEDIGYISSGKGSAVLQDGKAEIYPRAPNLLFGLWRQMFQYAVLHNKKRWYLIVEPRLTNSLINAGIKLVSVGEPRNYHGLRTPYFCDVEETERLLARHNPILLKWFTSGN